MGCYWGLVSTFDKTLLIVETLNLGKIFINPLMSPKKTGPFYQKLPANFSWTAWQNKDFTTLQSTAIQKVNDFG
jgi:hypothetical protein